MSTSPGYAFWLTSVKMRLVHYDAIQCTSTNDDSVLIAWHRHKYSAKRIAKELNDRYESGYLERKAEMQQVKAAAGGAA